MAYFEFKTLQRNDVHFYQKQCTTAGTDKSQKYFKKGQMDPTLSQAA